MIPGQRGISSSRIENRLREDHKLIFPKLFEQLNLALAISMAALGRRVKGLHTIMNAYWLYMTQDCGI